MAFFKKKGNKRRRKFIYKNLKCSLCEHGIKDVSYKDVYRLKKFTTARGRILPMKRTGMCASHQRGVTEAIKIARHMALMPFVVMD